MTEKGIDMKYLPVLVVVALLTASCGKKPSRDFITQQPADSTKLVMIFEVPAGVSAAVAAEEFRYQINTADYSPYAVVWVGGAVDSVFVFEKSAPWRPFTAVDSIFLGIRVAAEFFSPADSHRIRSVFYVHPGAKAMGMVKDSLNFVLYHDDLISSGQLVVAPFLRRSK